MTVILVSSSTDLDLTRSGFFWAKLLMERKSQVCLQQHSPTCICWWIVWCYTNLLLLQGQNQADMVFFTSGIFFYGIFTIIVCYHGKSLTWEGAAFERPLTFLSKTERLIFPSWHIKIDTYGDDYFRVVSFLMYYYITSAGTIHMKPPSNLIYNLAIYKFYPTSET